MTAEAWDVVLALAVKLDSSFKSAKELHRYTAFGRRRLLILTDPNNRAPRNFKPGARYYLSRPPSTHCVATIC